MHLLAALLALLTPTHSQINGGLSFLFAGNRDILGLVERSGLRIRSVSADLETAGCARYSISVRWWVGFKRLLRLPLYDNMV